VTDPIALLAITAFLEARLLQLTENPNLDPLTQSQFTHRELIDITEANEVAAATKSLDGQLQHWQDGRTITARDWIQELYDQVWPIAKQNGFSCFLAPLPKILREGNEAQQWLQLHAVGVSTRCVLTQAIAAIRDREVELEEKICSSATI
jgi:predicted glutamate--cysteine ligase